MSYVIIYIYIEREREREEGIFFNFFFLKTLLNI
jgi:hypothetical protein